MLQFDFRHWEAFRDLWHGFCMAISQRAVCSSGFLWLLGARASTSSAVLWSKGCKGHLALTADGNAWLSADDLSDLLLCFVHKLLTLPLGANSGQVSGSSALLGSLCWWPGSLGWEETVVCTFWTAAALYRVWVFCLWAGPWIFLE